MRIALVIPTLVLIAIGSYAGWYSYARQAKIAQIEPCIYNLEHPKPPTMMKAPDGTLAPVYTLEGVGCPTDLVPPKLWDLIRGSFSLGSVPKGMKVNQFSLLDTFLGNYTYGPDISSSCDQSATTTDCASLASLPQTPPPPYVGTNVVYPVEEWTSATNTPISFYGFSFMLPAGWHGSVYSKEGGGQSLLVQKDLDKGGFRIACPPDGKGLEAATRLSSEERTVNDKGNSLKLAFEKWTAPGNDPWSYVWIRTASDDLLCLVEGGTDTNSVSALRMLYQTWTTK